MLDTLKNLESYKVFEFFHALNQIPRESGNETAVSNWLVDFAKKRNLEVKQDAVKNVIIKKPGTRGYEQAKTVILQGHMDMVCEKEADSPHDFSKDPIAFIVEGDSLHADKTTLGADDGMAVAMSLAILDSNDIPHPPLEVLLTVSEETGMDGAEGLDVADISGRTLINIDSEEEGEFLVGCAGGVEVYFHLPITWKDIPQDAALATLKVSGLFGGHSGSDINKGRGNAIKLLARVLYQLAKESEYHIVKINGGTKHNAIPRETTACIAFNKKDTAKVQKLVEAYTAFFKNELFGSDDGVSLELLPCDCEKQCKKVFSKKTTENLVKLLLITRHGLIEMSQAIPGLVQSSNNVAIVETDKTKNEVKVSCAVRSSIASCKAAIADEFAVVAELCGAQVEFSAGYPAWEYTPKSPIRDVFVKVYKDMFGKEPIVTAIHAGLECGLFAKKFGGELDQISFGPDIRNAHTPKEHTSISSVDRSWKFLKAVLAELK